ncbi:hypothetical protein [Schlesneria paludicola]|uniref:hypothetical protein n=1 Tax=Schlesneria paludicola TaxID=360056 RepID=UPI00029A9E9F|nr:hypothetical protein [Schlesneria paludicola]
MSRSELTEADEIQRKLSVQRLTHIFFVSLKFGFPLLGIWLIVALVVPFCFSASIDKVVDAKLTFLSLGCMFGIVQLFLGVLLAMIGVTSDFKVDASAGTATVKLAAASPGILLIVLGNAVFCVTLMRQIELSETRQERRNTQLRHEASSDGHESILPKGPQ